jgi:hypothetical protein
MGTADIIAAVFGSITVLGGVVGWFGHRLDKVNAILSTKQEVIDAQQQTISVQDRQILLLEAAAQATNALMRDWRGAVAQGGDAS